MRRVREFSLLLLAALLACDSASNPDKVAGKFVDAYFLELDLDQALALAEGPAARRIEGDRSRASPTRETAPVAEAKPGVYYGRPERRAVSNELVEYTYRLEIHTGSSDFERPILVQLARRGGAWKVIGFRETGPRYEEGGEAGAPGAIGVRTSTGPRSASSSAAPPRSR